MRAPRTAGWLHSACSPAAGWLHRLYLEQRPAQLPRCCPAPGQRSLLSLLRQTSSPCLPHPALRARRWEHRRCSPISASVRALLPPAHTLIAPEL